MAELVKETLITNRGNLSPALSQAWASDATSSQTAEYLIYFVFGIAEVLLAFRLVFKFLGAGASGSFVGLIYAITNIIILPFEGIFRRGVSQGIETTSVFEPSTVVAIIVYAVLAWGIVSLLRILSGQKQTS